MNDDVYSPAADDRDVDEAPARAIVRGLRQTWPWTAFLGALLLLSTVLTFLAGTTMLLSGSVLPGQVGSGNGLFRFMGLAYGALAVLYVVPTVLVLRFAVAAFRVSDTDGLAAAATAVRRQRDVWIGFGVLALLVIVLYCGGMGALFAGVFAAVAS